MRSRAIASVFFSLVAASSALVSFQPGVASSSPAAQRFTVYSSGLEPITGARVRVERPGTALNLATGANGSTHEVVLDTGLLYTVYLKQRSVPWGTALGQSIEGWSVSPPLGPPDPNGNDAWEDVLTQPVLRTVSMDSGLPVIESPMDEFWRIEPSSPFPGSVAKFNFLAEVGSLPTWTAILRYFLYAGVTPDNDDYVYGLAIRCSAIESFGPAGAGLQIDCSRMGFTEAPDVDVYYVTTQAHLGETTLQVETKGWIPHTDLLLGLTGQLGEGVTLILLRPHTDGDGASVLESVRSDPPFGPAQQQGAPGSAACDVMYDPTAYEVGLDHSSPPARHQLCPQAATITKTETTRETRMVPSLTVCGNNNGGVSKTETVTWSSAFSVTWLTPGNVEVTAGSDFKTSETLTYTLAPGSGEGCGQCLEGYLRRSKVTDTWLYEWPSWDLFYPHTYRGCKDKTKVKHKLHAGYDIASCDIPCGGGGGDD